MLETYHIIRVRKRDVDYEVGCNDHTLHYTITHDRALRYINADLVCVVERACADLEVRMTMQLGKPVTITHTPEPITKLTSDRKRKLTPVRIHDPPP